MNYKLIETEEMVMIGKKIKTNTLDGKAVQLWSDFISGIHEIPNRKDLNTTYGISLFNENFIPGKVDIDYFAACEVLNGDDIPEGYEILKLDSTKYAVFTYRGEIEKLGEFYGKIHRNLLPENNLIPSGKPELELYDERYAPDSVNSEFDIYIPIN